MSTITIIPIHGADTTWNGMASCHVGAHACVSFNWDATTASLLGTGDIANQSSLVDPNFIGHTNYLSQGFGVTDVHFATTQDGVAMYLRNATEQVGNAFTFLTHSGPVTLSIADIDHALGFNGPTGAHGSFENLGFEIMGLGPFKDMLISGAPHWPTDPGPASFGVFAATNYNFNTAPIPEMGTWAMLLCGFAMMGVAVFRRARTARAIQ